MTPFSRRRPGGPASIFSGPVIILAVIVVAAVVLEVLWGFGYLSPKNTEPSTAGLVAVVTPARPIPPYARITRDHLWDTKKNRIAVIYLPPKAVSKEMITNLSDVIGRVMAREKAPGYVFTEDDFLPKGTREGLVGGIPPGKRAVRVAADRVEGVFGLRAGDHFDLVATMPIDDSRGSQAFNVGGVYGNEMALEARLSNWQKQATVRVMVQNGVIVEPMTTRQIPIMVSGGPGETSHARMRPVQEVVIAIDPDEVARLTEALAVDAHISMVPRSGRPDDPIDSVTPDLHPVSPFNGGAGGPAGDAVSGGAGFSMVETITGRTHALTPVPRR